MVYALLWSDSLPSNHYSVSQLSIAKRDSKHSRRHYGAPAGDIDKQYAKISEVDLMSDDEFPALFISCSTLKDPQSFNGRYHNFEIITFVDYELFKLFTGRDNYHTEKYDLYKKRACEKFLKSLEKVVLNVRNKIV